jgi:predicted adenine nucleotide alpha hydrolase (AANH) superfamily ATPase
MNELDNMYNLNIIAEMEFQLRREENEESLENISLELKKLNKKLDKKD